MEDLQPKVIQGISEIAKKKIDVLSGIWKRLFEPEIGNEHMNMLIEHVEAFFTDIIVETQNRETAIRDRINSLNREKLELKRLLKEDANEVTADVPLHTLQMRIDESLKSLRLKLRQRHEEIEVLLKEQDEVCNDLEEPRRSLVSDPLPSEQEMEEFRDYIEKLKDQRYERYSSILQIRDDIKQLLSKLEITSLNDYDKELVSSNNMKPTSHNIDKLKAFYDLLASQFEKMSSQINNMRKRLAQLWKYLDISENHFRRFAKYTDITQTTYNKLHEEVQRCELIKKENIRNFIEKVRVEIEEYWDKCLKSDAERMRFPSYTASIFNEDVLELHEDELRDLKMFYENNEAFFNMIQERQELWNQMESLQNKEADPKRYNNRGGQLLKEEKERKMITMKLPKIEAKLIELAEQFEKNNNRPFTMYGVRIQDIIEADYEVKRQEKITKSGKKVAPTPQRTPMRTNMTTRQPLTIEQTIINRTAMKTTAGRLRVAQTLPKKAISTTTSSTASSARSVRSETGKRRIVNQRAAGPQAKRQLLGAFVSPSPAGVLRPQNSNTGAIRKVPTKNKTLKVYNVGSVIKRRSRTSGGAKRRSSIRTKPKFVPEIQLTSDQSTTERDATSYEGFENYVYQSRSVVRSSEVPRPHHQYLAVNHHGFASPVLRKQATPSGKRIATPSASTPTVRGLQPRELEFSQIF